MPNHPRKACRKFLCSAIAGDSGYCDKHRPPILWGKGKPGREKQGGYDKHHRLMRAAAFQRDRGLCQMCLREGKYTPATIAHHIKPMLDHPELKYTLDNIASLCRPCHERVHGRRT